LVWKAETGLAASWRFGIKVPILPAFKHVLACSFDRRADVPMMFLSAFDEVRNKARGFEFGGND
jgi:hypothetical protein